jgi:uncharacterized protein YceH (UPF0502 family)
MSAVPVLSAVEARVLAVLVEKQRSVPDSYPLTLNALLAGCNQKSARDPVMQVSDAEAREALDRLRGLSLAIESSGSRVLRYEHNLERALQIPSTSAAVLAVLMLRGPQTAGELRGNCDRLHQFSDISAVLGFLHELAARPAGALVVELPRQPGARENRWAQLLCGAPAASPAASPAPAGSGDADLRSKVEALEARVADLQAQLDAMRAGGTQATD